MLAFLSKGHDTSQRGPVRPARSATAWSRAAALVVTLMVALVATLMGPTRGGVAPATAASRAAPGPTPSPGRSSSSARDDLPGSRPRTSSGPWITFEASCGPMGSAHGYSDERPRHEVCLSAFSLQAREVTVRSYGACVKAKGCTAPVAFVAGRPTRRRCNWGRPGHDDHPVNCVTWSQAAAYCAWARARLPTEAEWERAALGRGTGRRASGRRGAGPGCPAVTLADPGHPFRLGCGAGGTRPAGASPGDRGSAGLHDLVGNVSEWMADWYELRRYRHGRHHDPKGPHHGRAHSVRGCSFQCLPGSLLTRPTTRQYAATWDPVIGFRCARGRH